MLKKVFLFTFSIFAVAFAYGKSSIKINVNAGDYNRLNTVVKVDISSMDLKEGQKIELYENTTGKCVLKSSQILLEKNNPDMLLFILDGITEKGTTRTYIAKKGNKSSTEKSMTIKDDSSSLTLLSNGRNILSYKYTLTLPPNGVDEVFARSGYIHPAYTPSGFVLTAIQPEDHRHHYGIWNPWTKLEYDGKIYDLWNLGENQGTVRAREVIDTYQGDIMAGFTALLDHNIRNNGSEKTIINEIWDVKAWNIKSNGFLWDFDSYLTPSTNLPVLLKEYRYEGLGFRANKHWVKDNCEMISSEGLDRTKMDGTRGRWMYTIGDTGNGKRGGLLMMDSPQNYNYPEPIRIWSKEMLNGYVFMNFCPTKNMDWKLESGKTYKLSYRLYAFDGEMTPERAESLWIDFAYPPKITIK